MFLQFSPPERKEKEVKIVKKEVEDVTFLSLAPFGPRPKLFFDNVVVGTTSTRTLIIQNPTNHDFLLQTTNDFPDDVQIEFSWLENSVPQNSEVSLVLTWTPLNEGSWLHSVRLNYGPKKDVAVPVILKSALPKNTKGKSTKAKTKKLPTFVPKKTSPIRTNARKKSPLKRVALPDITNIPQTSSPNRFPTHNKENNALALTNDYTIDRRETYCIKAPPISHNLCDSFVINNSVLNFTDDNIQKKLHSNSFTLSPVIATINEEVGNKRVIFSSDKDATFELNTNATYAKLDPKGNVDDLITNQTLTQESSITRLHSLAGVNVKNAIQANLWSNNDKDKYCMNNENSNGGRTPNLCLINISNLVNGSTPQTPNSIFDPNICSTEEKSVNNSSHFHGKQKCLFKKSPGDQLNSSAETYVKGNLSSETYTKGNSSVETYVKGNLSSETYTKDIASPRDSLESVRIAQSSPLLPEIKTITARDQKPLQFDARFLNRIEEESSISDSSISQCLKRKSDLAFNATPPKRPNLGTERLTDWSKRNSIIRINRKSTGLTILKGDVLEITNTHTIQIKNPFLFATTDADPFVLSSYFANEEFLEKLEKDFKKCLNALLIPSMFVNMDQDGFSLNIEKLLKECRKKAIQKVSINEPQKAKTQMDLRLGSIRKNALNLVRTKEVQTIFLRLIASVDCNKLSIRQDRDVHLDLSLQSEIMSIVLSYNPLWLRVGLEALYNEVIVINTNSDITSFLLERFFKDPLLLKKYKSVHTPKYKIDIKKFILKKFLMLVYVLDQSKTKKLITHDPCLFRKNAPIKESREALLKFSRETLFAVGDITKQLKYLGYVVCHKQTYIDEFDYTVNCLGVDLRDGVRLTRLMEILLIRNNITKDLRVPAISRLQKIHNLKIVYRVLDESNFAILYDIGPEDIVDGYREKTLSLLWQILYKFHAPLMVKTATTIQKWWRSEAIISKRDTLKKIWLEKNSAACKIQLWFKKRKLLLKLEELARIWRLYREHRRQEIAASKIQKNVRSYFGRKKYLHLRTLTIRFQAEAKRWLVNNYHKRRILAAITIQTSYRAMKIMNVVRSEFLHSKWAAIVIQNWYRNVKVGRASRVEFLAYKNSAIVIQQRFRSWQLMKIESAYYHLIRDATIVIQRRFRVFKAIKVAQEQYLMLKWAVLLVQQRYRANKVAVVQRTRFLHVKTSALIIQQRYRAYVLMKQQLSCYKNLKQATIFIQRLFRANKARKQAQDYYNKQRQAARAIQQFYKSITNMRIVREEYQRLREVTILIQKRFKANILAKQTQKSYNNLRQATISIQQRFRALQAMRKAQNQFKMLKWATIAIQRRYRAKKLCLAKRNDFIRTRRAAIIIQQRYRAHVCMKQEFTYYVSLKQATITIQRRFRANMLARESKKRYETLRKSVVIIQRRFKAKLMGRQERESFYKLKQAAISVQKRFRALDEMRMVHSHYVKLKWATRIIQQRYRANSLARISRAKFVMLRKAIIIIQNRYRAYTIMKQERANFLCLKHSVVVVQRRFRAQLLSRNAKESYSNLKRVTITVQRRFRAKLLMKFEKRKYEKLRYATVKIQRFYRSIKEMRREVDKYVQLKKSAIIIQKTYKGWLQKKRFEAWKQATIVIQQHCRSIWLMRVIQHEYQTLRRSAIVMQRLFKTRQTQQQYQKLKYVTIHIQRKYRAKALMKFERAEFQKIKTAVIKIQEYWRGYVLMKKQKLVFEMYIEKVKIIQKQNKAATKIQALWRGYRVKVTAKPRMVEIFERLQKANDLAVPQKTISWLCTKAILRLEDTSCSILEVAKALEDVDCVTRKCRDSCVRWSKSLPALLYATLSSTNRSLPDIRVSTAATNILINFCKFNPIKDFCWVPEEIDNILTIMLHFCDKEEQLFPALCTLLWLLGHTKQYKNVIKQTPNFSLKMFKMQNLIKRKGNMIKNSKKHDSLFSAYKNLPLPSLTSDWGLEYVNKLYSFSNSIHAFDELQSLFS